MGTDSLTSETLRKIVTISAENFWSFADNCERENLPVDESLEIHLKTILSCIFTYIRDSEGKEVALATIRKQVDSMLATAEKSSND